MKHVEIGVDFQQRKMQSQMALLGNSTKSLKKKYYK